MIEEFSDLPYTLQVEEPTDKNGNSANYVRQYGILQHYNFVGIDCREFAIFEDSEGNRQEAYLDHNGNFDHGHLKEGGFFGGSPESHVVESAETYGQWMYVEPDIIKIIEEEDLGDIEPGYQDLKPSTKAAERWNERSDLDIDLLNAWDEALEFEWPRENDPAEARYHPEAGTPILRQGSRLVTVYPSLKDMDDEIMKGRIIENLPDDIQ